MSENLTPEQIRSLKKIKHHVFIDKKYKIIWQKPRSTKRNKNSVATCDPPFIKNKKITINPNIPEKKLLAAMIDESIHTTIWPLDNDFVDLMSDAISHFLWRAGWRIKKS